MRISDWSSDVCSSDLYWYRLRYAGEHDRYQPLPYRTRTAPAGPAKFRVAFGSCCRIQFDQAQRIWNAVRALEPDMFLWLGDNIYADSDQPDALVDLYARGRRSAEHTSELQSLMRNSYAVFCLNKKLKHNKTDHISAA